MSHTQIIEAIIALRRAHSTILAIFTRGACYEFYRFLKVMEPDAVPYYDGAHVFTRIRGKYYDITGEVEFTQMGHDGLRLMTAEEELQAQFWALKEYTADKLK